MSFSVKLFSGSTPLPFSERGMSTIEKPEKSVEKPPLYGKPKSKRLSIRSVKGRRYPSLDRDGQLSKSVIPRDVHRKLWGLFAEIEREFERVCIENAECNVPHYFRKFLLLCICNK